MRYIDRRNPLPRGEAGRRQEKCIERTDKMKVSEGELDAKEKRGIAEDLGGRRGKEKYEKKSGWVCY